MRWDQIREQNIRASRLVFLFGVTQPPVDIHAIASSMGVAVETTDLAVAGELNVDNGQPKVRIRASDSRTRQRFTLAHELAHLMLHSTEQLHYRDNSFSGSPQEIEANRYAAELLMPFYLLDPFVMEYGGDVTKLAALFEVSPQAMNIRLDMMVGLI